MAHFMEGAGRQRLEYRVPAVQVVQQRPQRQGPRGDLHTSPAHSAGLDIVDGVDAHPVQLQLQVVL